MLTKSTRTENCCFGGTATIQAIPFPVRAPLGLGPDLQLPCQFRPNQPARRDKSLSGFGHAFSWQNGTITRLPDYGFSVAYVVNEAGRIAGESDIGGDASHACYWEGGQLHDLNPSWSYGSYAYEMNERGYIVGELYNGPGRAQEP